MHTVGLLRGYLVVFNILGSLVPQHLRETHNRA